MKIKADEEGRDAIVKLVGLALQLGGDKNKKEMMILLSCIEDEDGKSD